MAGTTTAQEWASFQLGQALWQETFFFMYHMKLSEKDVLRMPIRKRKWMSQRYIQQRDMEREYMEKQRSKPKSSK